LRNKIQQGGRDMSDNKKYYYLKLKDNFFESDEMIVLETMPDGYLYSNILLKLYLRSLKNEGRLMFNERIPFNSTMLASVTRHSVGVIEKAMQVFKQLGLVEVLDNGAIYMLDIQNFIGESSTEADRKRAYRNRIQDEKKVGIPTPEEDVGQMSDKCPDKNPPELEIEKEIDIELEKEKDIVRDLFDHYLSQNIINHKKLTNSMRSAAKARLKDYSFDELKQAITNYATVLKSDNYWFTHKYTFADLMRDKDIRKFVDEADPINNFAKDSYKQKTQRPTFDYNPDVDAF